MICGFISFVLPSCTVINIKSADSVKTQIYPGLAIIQVFDTHNNVAINARGVGTYFNREGATLGYFHDQRVYINDLSECVTVFFETLPEPLICKQ